MSFGKFEKDLEGAFLHFEVTDSTYWFEAAFIDRIWKNSESIYKKNQQIF